MNEVVRKALIYTDWANHYLEKSRNKKFISDLQQDISDGVLLADVIEAVTNDKVKDIKLKPKNTAQMVDNINACLNFLSGLGVSVDGISAKDIKEGNLKAILGLFFSLSRYKQQQKTQQAAQKSAEQSQVNQLPSTTPQQQQHHVDSATSCHAGHTTPQLNGGEVQSRLPSPFKNNKNTSVHNPSAKDTTSSSSSVNNANLSLRSKSHGAHSTSNDKAKSQQNQQNNILQVSSSSNSKNNNTRATSPGHQHSGIPTPGGKAIPTARSQSAAEKQINRTSASSTSSTSSTKSNPAKPPNKNSMLDKFKFFNSKEKDKKGGAVKGSSKNSAAASANSSRSDTDSGRDTKSSTSPRSSLEAGASSSSNNGASSPKLPAKTGKKSLVRAFSTKRETPKTLTPDDNNKRPNAPSPATTQPRTPSPNTNIPVPGAPPPIPKTSPPPSRKTTSKSDKSEKSDKSDKSSKGGTLIPKSSSSSGKSKSAASTPTSSGGSQIPPPNFSMPKSSKSSKSSKEEKSKSSLNGKEHNKALFSSLPGVNAHKTLANKSSSGVSSPASTPDGNGGMLSHSNSNHSGIHHASKSSQEYSSNVIPAHQSRVQAQDNTYYRAVEHSATIANPHSNAHAPTDHMNMHNMVSKSSRTPKSQIVIPSARHGGNSMTQTVNIVKPTCTMAPSRSVAKADGNTQTNLSVIQKTMNSSKYAAARENSNHSVHSEGNYSKPHDSLFSNRVASPVTPQMQSPVINERENENSQNMSLSSVLSSSQSSSASTSVSSNDSVVHKPGIESSAYDRLYSSSSNSPRLGVKMLGKPANNVAIVQPRHGEKIETTFDREVRTETVNKPSSGKETTFSEKSTTFVDDCGETMDIKPMPPIMRALPYGYFRGYTGYTGLSSSRNFHIPGISVPPTQAMYASSTSRLGVNRPILEHGKFYSGQIKRSGSNCPSVNDPDYASDVDNYDYVSGYMSDGDILKNNRVDDWSSGYMSEGGASLYARRLQQRFREGMQAVKECMQKSSGVIDDDSFDDSSSISSGDISDTIAEISTDENLTGSSQGALSDTNPYSSLKRGPKDLTQGIHVSNGHGRIQGKRPNLGTSAFLGGEYNGDGNNPYGWGRKYYLPQNSKLLSSDPSDYAYPYSSCDQHSQWGRSEPSYGSLRKLSNSSQSEYGYRGESPHYAQSDKGTYSPTPSVKCDSTTNTDQSHLMETSLKRMQTARGAAPSNGSGTGIQYRRPLSNVSNSSGGSNKSNGSSKGSTAVGSRLAKHGVDNGTPTGIPRPGSAAAKISLSTHSDMGQDAYASSTLERKKKGLTTSKSSSNTAAPDFQSNTLGRRRLFDSKSSLSKGSNGENGGSMCPSTIISNPHATYGKGTDFKGQQSHYVNLQQLQAMQQCTLQQHGPASGNYITLEYSSPRNSGNNWLMRNGNGVMSETESMDSISSATSLSIQAQIQQARALSGASARILAQQRDQTQNQNQNQNQSGLHRSDSIKSTQSDIPFTHQKSLSEDLPRTNSFSQLSGPCSSATEQLASPTSVHASSRFTYPMTFTSGMPSSLSHHMVHSNTHHGMTFNSLPLAKVNRDEDGISRLTKSSTIDYAYLSDYAYSSVHGSNLSLISSASSSVNSSAEDRQAHEIRKLRRELEGAQDKVLTLSNQLNTNSHVVAAFEQSLSNMTSRLQALTLTAEQKDSELNELRHTIEALKRQSGLTITESGIISPNSSRRHTSPGVVLKDGPVHPHQRHVSESGIMRQMSSDSMSSINSLSSACSVTSQHSAATDTDCKGKKKKGWLRSSFSKAFNRKKNKNGSMSDVEPDTQSLRSNISAPNSPLLLMHGPPGGPLKGSHSSGALCETDDVGNVVDLKKQLREKDMKLTDIRLEALSSAHQLEQLRETMNKMKSEMSALKCDNERLNRSGNPMTPQHQRTLHISQSSLTPTRSNDSLDRSISLTDHSSLDMLLAETAANDREGKRVTLAMYLGSNPDPTKEGIEKPAEVLIGFLSVSGKTKWDILDNMVRKIFKEYVLRVDPVTNLGLSSESLQSYHVGEITRTKDSELPELLPIGYLVGETMQIGICLKG
ncbi:hypothetical protein SNE40_020304, partial [Patella caerulea]